VYVCECLCVCVWLNVKEGVGGGKPAVLSLEGDRR